MDGKMLARLGAIVFVAFAVTAAAIDIAHKDQPAPTRSLPMAGAETRRADPLRDILIRCQGMGETATRDAGCLAAWAESRRRFLGQVEGR